MLVVSIFLFKTINVHVSQSLFSLIPSLKAHCMFNLIAQVLGWSVVILEWLENNLVFTTDN